jgi:chorismate-pyruvate lyase|tara:strand:+ start:8034 stop:8585 length:552 start_codon:yes stop_codon:yes gene_type:complete
MVAQNNIFHDPLYPLSLIRRVRGISKLVYQEVVPNEVPEPYYSLLVHEGDMTSRLESYHEDTIKVRKLSSSNDGKAYFREVLLETMESLKPTEYGAIEITLKNLEEEQRSLVIEGKQPLGGILNDARIPYSSAPRAFLKIIPDNPMVEAFGSVEADHLYGRTNEITSYNGDIIARIVEILPSL